MSHAYFRTRCYMSGTLVAQLHRDITKGNTHTHTHPHTHTHTHTSIPTWSRALTDEQSKRQHWWWCYCFILFLISIQETESIKPFLEHIKINCLMSNSECIWIPHIDMWFIDTHWLRSGRWIVGNLIIHTSLLIHASLCSDEPSLQWQFPSAVLCW